MSAPAGVYLTGEGTPFVVDDDVFLVWRCKVPVLPGGDGAETAPLAERTERCGHKTTFFVGSIPTCPHHLAVAFRIARVFPDPPRFDSEVCA